MLNRMNFHGHATYDFVPASIKAQWNDPKENAHVGVQCQVNRFVHLVDPELLVLTLRLLPKLAVQRGCAVCTEDQSTRLLSKLLVLQRARAKLDVPTSQCGVINKT